MGVERLCHLEYKLVVNFFHLKSKAEMTSSCLYAADHTSAPGPIFKGYPNEISHFVALVITRPLVLFKSIQFLKKQCFDP